MLPERVGKEFNAQANQYGWKDLLIVAFYRTLGPLSLEGKEHGVLFCQAGTYDLENIFVFSPCKPLDAVASHLPLELFTLDKCKQLFDHFWRFKITEEEKEDLLGQLLGPPKLMEYFFTGLATIKTEASKVTHEELQSAVDNALEYFKKSVVRRLARTTNAYQDYIRIVLYPENYGGQIDKNSYIIYSPQTIGFDILRKNGSTFTDSSVLRMHRQGNDFIVEMPSRATQLIMTHIMFEARVEVRVDIERTMS